GNITIASGHATHSAIDRRLRKRRRRHGVIHRGFTSSRSKNSNAIDLDFDFSAFHPHIISLYVGSNWSTYPLSRPHVEASKMQWALDLIIFEKPLAQLRIGVGAYVVGRKYRSIDIIGSNFSIIDI